MGEGEATGGFLNRFRAGVRAYPLAVAAALGTTLFLAGLIVGLVSASQDEQIAELNDEVTELRADVGDARDDARDAEESRDLAVEEADRLSGRVRTLRTEQQEAAASRGTGAAGEVYTVGEFTVADVQVSDDGIGDFEVRARVTNNGPAADGVDMQATLFSSGSVVGDMEAYEDFDSGQTRTVTFFGLDAYGEWDEIEFTFDEGF